MANRDNIIDRWQDSYPEQSGKRRPDEKILQPQGYNGRSDVRSSSTETEYYGKQNLIEFHDRRDYLSNRFSRSPKTTHSPATKPQLYTVEHIEYSHASDSGDDDRETKAELSQCGQCLEHRSDDVSKVVSRAVSLRRQSLNETDSDADLRKKTTGKMKGKNSRRKTEKEKQTVNCEDGQNLSFEMTPSSLQEGLSGYPKKCTLKLTLKARDTENTSDRREIPHQTSDELTYKSTYDSVRETKRMVFPPKYAHTFRDFSNVEDFHANVRTKGPNHRRIQLSDDTEEGCNNSEAESEKSDTDSDRDQRSHPQDDPLFSANVGVRRGPRNNRSQKREGNSDRVDSSMTVPYRVSHGSDDESFTETTSRARSKHEVPRHEKCRGERSYESRSELYPSVNTKHRFQRLGRCDVDTERQQSYQANYYEGKNSSIREATDFYGDQQRAGTEGDSYFQSHRETNDSFQKRRGLDKSDNHNYFGDKQNPQKVWHGIRWNSRNRQGCLKQGEETSPKAAYFSPEHEIGYDSDRMSENHSRFTTGVTSSSRRNMQQTMHNPREDDNEEGQLCFSSEQRPSDAKLLHEANMREEQIAALASTSRWNKQQTMHNPREDDNEEGELSFSSEQRPGDGKLLHEANMREAQITAVAYLNDFGKKLNDSIISCHVTLQLFRVAYPDWHTSRDSTLSLLTFFEQEVRKSENWKSGYSKFCDFLKTAGHWTEEVLKLTPYAALATPVGRGIPQIFQKAKGFFAARRNTERDPEFDHIRQILERDIQFSSELGMYALQCEMQFKETVELFVKFRDIIFSQQMADFVDDMGLLNFMIDLHDADPSNPDFLKLIRRAYERFHDTQGNEPSMARKAFCTFVDEHPSALNTLVCLSWSFRSRTIENDLIRCWNTIGSTASGNNGQRAEAADKINTITGILMTQRREVEENVTRLFQIP